MANFLVVIELVGDHIHPGSLEALGQARRVGSTVGATVYALVPCGATPGYGDDDVIAVLSRGGADKVLLATTEAFAAPPRWGTHGPLLLSACSLLPPSLVVFAETDGAGDLGARAAAHLGAALLTDAWVDADENGLVLFGGRGDQGRRLDGEIDFPVVALVPPGRYLPALGDEEAEVEVLTPPAMAANEFVEIEAVPDRPAAIIVASGAAASELAQSIDGGEVVTASATARLVIAAMPTVQPLDNLPAWRNASVRIALGANAAECSRAHYAVEGDATSLTADLARVLSARVRNGEKAE